MTEQPYVWGIIRVPYGDTPMDDRSDLDDVILQDLRALAVKLGRTEAEIHCLDHVGVAEWMKEVVEAGLLA